MSKIGRRVKSLHTNIYGEGILKRGRKEKKASPPWR